MHSSMVLNLIGPAHWCWHKCCWHCPLLALVVVVHTVWDNFSRGSQILVMLRGLANDLPIYSTRTNLFSITTLLSTNYIIFLYFLVKKLPWQYIVYISKSVIWFSQGQRLQSLRVFRVIKDAL